MSYAGINNKADVVKSIKVEEASLTTKTTAPAISGIIKGFIQQTKFKDLRDGREGSYTLSNTYIFINEFDNKWCFTKGIVDTNNYELKFIVDRKIRYKGVSENFTISVSISYLKAHKDTGIKLRLYGESRATEFEIPAYYIQAFLERIS